MKARTLIIVSIFVVGTTGAVMLVAGAAGSNPIVAIEDPDAPMVAADQLGANERFAHVKGFLDSIPDAGDMAASQGCQLPFAEGITLRHLRCQDRVVAGVIEIVRRGQTVGLFPSWMELIPIDASHFVIHRAWHGPEVAMVFVSTPRLDVIPGDPAEQTERLTSGESLYLLAEGSYVEVGIPRDLEPGEHPVACADWAREIGEVLLLYPSTRAEASNRTHVMKVEPCRGRVTVVAPIGNAFRDFDASEAHVRLLRDPRSGRAVGDGPNVRPFVLGEELSRVERWLE